jgi:hypothetical protein
VTIDPVARPAQDLGEVIIGRQTLIQIVAPFGLWHHKARKKAVTRSDSVPRRPNDEPARSRGREAGMGMAVSDAVCMLLVRVAAEMALPSM